MRLIDADKIMEDIAIAERSTSKDYSLLSMARYISIQPTIDAEPVRHGHFIFTHKPNIYGGISVKCSECGYEGVIAHIEDHHYCWVCGAKMEEK